MSADIFKTLSWLPAPVDFRDACRRLLELDGDCGPAVRSLANHALSDAQLKRLAMVIGELRGAGRTFGGLTPFRLGLIGNGTLDLFGPALIATAARHGFLLECVTAEYGQAVQEALSPQSRINQARCDAVILALDHRGLPLRPCPGDAGEAASSLADSLGLIRQMQAGLRDHGGARTIVQTIAAPAESLFGSRDRLIPGTLRHLIDSFNQALCDAPQDDSAALLDVAALAQTVGLAEWHSPTQWNMAKLPFATDYLPLYADHLCRLLGAMGGKSRRALILDLDNTLWGGVVGDDGVEGLVLGEGDGTGEAFLSVQRMALALRERGVVLAVSSKNTDAVARRPFQDHPEMLLREGHIAVFQANWNDKATNIKSIADDLALGLDAMVFLDDNPAERALVRQFLPQVAVPELPEDPALYARVLAAAGYFEAVAFSDEDRKRADFYQDNARRVVLGKAAANVDDYLAALEMQVTFQPFEAMSRARIAQLINKSNQFNLTTRRYTESEVRSLEDDPSAFTLQVRLKDRFGDNGMISVIICRTDGAASWIIDTWLMSCRVLGRGVERMVLKELVRQARIRGVKTLIGTYRPSARNALVKDHYRGLGFVERAPEAGGVTCWSLSTARAVAAPEVEVVRLGLSQRAAS